MKQLLQIRTGSTYLFLASAATALLLLSACQMVIDPALLEDAEIGAASETSMEGAATEGATAEAEPAEESVTEATSNNDSASNAPTVPGVEPAKATVNIPSLRAHEAPSENSEMIASLEEDETYPVQAISSDGVWIQLEIPDTPDGSGWVSASFVTLEGDITNISIIGAPVTATEDEEVAEDGMTEETMTEDAVADEGTSADSMSEGPMATVNTRSLRVREAPSEDSEVITGVREGESYPVLEVSTDGTWVHLEIPRAPEGVGWVSAEFVDIEGEMQDSTSPVAEESETDVAGEPEAAASDSATEDDAGQPAAESTEVAAESETDVEGEAAAETAAEPDAAASDSATEGDASEPAAESTEVAAGYALVSTDLPLRVRSEPTTEEDNKVGNVFDGEIYRVLEISDDGLWVRIDIPQLELEDGGWVSAEYLILGSQ